jgi:hypothetical protein
MILFGVTPLTAKISVQVIMAMFPGEPISCFADITWTTHSLDLAVPDYFFTGYVKSKAYKTHPAELVK